MARGNVALLVGGLAAALIVVVVLAPRASGDPDGLERVAADEGFAEHAADAPVELLAAYLVPGVEDETASTILAGAIGVVAVTAVVLLAARVLRARSARGGGRDGAASPGPR